MRDTDVLLVADAEDPHALLIQHHLAAAGASLLTLNLSNLRAATLRADLTTALVGTDTGIHRVSKQTAAWWHRAGTTPVRGLDPEEANLIADENPHLLQGMLYACGVRWVDPPHLVARAEKKLYQLSIARQLGIRIPETLATNQPEQALRFFSGREVVTKALSPGVGIAPFTDRVAKSDLHALSANPTLIQGLVEATADARVVAVNGQSWTWLRPRTDGVVDWREEDPHGSGFQQATIPDLSARALQMTAALDLTISVQDWLVTPDGIVFLEVNPQGGWHFLEGADTLIAPAIASHLMHVDQGAEGNWPPAIKRFLWDFLPASKAPNNDGIVSPHFSTPPWVDEVAAWQGAIDVAQRANAAAQESAATAEAKASRLVQVSLTLITIAIALAAFQLAAVLGESWPRLLLVLPALTAISFLALAAAEALEVDRVGVYRHAQPEDLRLRRGTSRDALVLAAEELGRRLARWTANHKITDLMQARAWFSRGLAALLIAGLIAGATFAFNSGPQSDESNSPAPLGSTSNQPATAPTPPDLAP